VPLEDGRFVCQLHVQGSVVIGGLGDGLGGVEWEAEVAFGATPGIFGFAGFLMAVIGGEGGAEFIGAVRSYSIRMRRFSERTRMACTRLAEGRRIRPFSFRRRAGYTIFCPASRCRIR